MHAFDSPITSAWGGLKLHRTFMASRAPRWTAQGLPLRSCLRFPARMFTADTISRSARPLLLSLLVSGIDVGWSALLISFGKPWLLRSLDRPAVEAARFVQTVIEPRQWIAYFVLLAVQMTWVIGIAPRRMSVPRLRQIWWLGVGIITVSSLLLRVDLALTAEASLLLLGVQLMDLALLYWLSTGLLTPAATRRQVIPGWR